MVFSSAQIFDAAGDWRDDGKCSPVNIDVSVARTTGHVRVLLGVMLNAGYSLAGRSPATH